MRRRALRLVAVAAMALAAAVPAPALVDLELVVDGLDRPLLVTHAGDGSGRVFLVEQSGRIRIHDGQLLDPPFLDLSGRVSCCGERGLLGLAFHPGYAENGLFYVNYTNGAGDTVLARFEVGADPNVADADSEVVLLTLDQPFANHNGGHIAFGPDGYLYVATGDGGSGGDPQNNAQNLGSLLGKILRLDVDSATPYAVPADNPFVGRAGAAEEIWAYGLRNPWRFSFDRDTGDLYIGDVGQGEREEIDFQPASSPGGENYGWRIREGSQCFEPAVGCAEEGLTAPVLEYLHDQGCSVTGGYRYRGPKAATLDRFYLYGDFCSGRVWGGRPNTAGNWRERLLADTGANVSSFGEDEAGRLYLVDHGGRLYRLSGRPLFADDFTGGDLGRWSKAVGAVSVTQPGLLGEEFALEVSVEGSARRSFVETRRVRGERTVETCFALRPEDVAAEGGPVTVLELWSRGARKRVVELRLAPGRRHRLELWARGGGSLTRRGGTALKRNKPTELCLEWAAATGTGAADGEALLRRGRRVRARATGLDNGGDRLRRLRLGLPQGSAAVGPGGGLLFDDVVITP
ncbi:MAG: PQQ-dependent sugar dehydrogenase [Thermoanaerobaculia bacterium]|nr:PQQ-dependent sugar dehydrogenase [Thermoanaerobaculia bacterium]